MNQENQKKFTGIFIPAAIFNMQELSWKEKIIWCEIQALAGDDVCFATNEYFAEQFNTTPSKISNIISKLKKLGLVEQVYFDGRTRHLKVHFDINGQCSIAEMGNADLPKSAMQDSQNGQCSIYKNKEKNKNKNNIYIQPKQESPKTEESKPEEPKRENLQPYGEFRNVFLTKNEVKNLISNYGLLFEDAIEVLSDYIVNKQGKKYKNHYAVMKKNGWVWEKVHKLPNSDMRKLQLVQDPNAKGGYREETIMEYYKRTMNIDI